MRDARRRESRPSDERYVRALRKKLREATAKTMELAAAGTIEKSDDARDDDDVERRLARWRSTVEDTLVKLRDAGFSNVDDERRRGEEDAKEVIRQRVERRRAGARRREEDERRSIEAKRRRVKETTVKSDALWWMHSMAKREGEEMDVEKMIERATTCARDAPRADAKSTSAGTWATAKLVSRLEKTSSWCERSERALGECVTALCRRTVDIGADGADARAASTTVWAAATVSKTRCGPFVDDAWARRAVNGAVDVLKARAEDANAQDAANAMWGAAKLRRKLDDACVRALVRRLADSAETRAEEMSIALWALATYVGDGWKDAATHAEPLIARAKEMAKKQPKQWSAQAVANAAWAAGKVATTGTSDVRDAKQLVTHLFSIAKTSKFTSQGFANVVYAAGAVRVDARLLPDVAKFAATGLKTRASTLSGADLAAVVETMQALRLHTSLSDGDRLKREIIDAVHRHSNAFDWQTVGRLDVVFEDVFEDDSDALSTIRDMLRARGAETCAEIDACRDHFERGSAEAMLARAPNAPLAAADARAFVVDDSTGSVKKKLRRVGWSVVSWHRFSCGDVIKGTPWPESASEGDGFFGAAVVRLPPTKASFAMIASVVAARVAFGGDVWIYGAVTEGLRSVASDLPKVGAKSARRGRILFLSLRKSAGIPRRADESPRVEARLDGATGTTTRDLRRSHRDHPIPSASRVVGRIKMSLDRSSPSDLRVRNVRYTFARVGRVDGGLTTNLDFFCHHLYAGIIRTR